MLLLRKLKSVLIVALALIPLTTATAFCQSFAAGFGTGNVLPYTPKGDPQQNGLNAYAMKVGTKHKGHKTYH